MVEESYMILKIRFIYPISEQTKFHPSMCIELWVVCSLRLTFRLIDCKLQILRQWMFTPAPTSPILHAQPPRKTFPGGPIKPAGN